MPRKAKRPCQVFSCRKFAVDGETYCEEHLKKENRNYDKFSRGYKSGERYDARWNRVRKVYLSGHPLCEECLKENKITRGTIVHHIVPVSENENLKYDLENLETVCASCHQKIHNKLGVPVYKF